MSQSTASYAYKANKIEKMFPAGPANSATLTKMHFVDILYDRLGLSRSEASSVLEAIFDEVQAALVMGREVKLANFGTFATREKSARPGRNPRTGEEHVVSARRVVSFVPAPYLRGSVAMFHDPQPEGPKEQ